jgi:ParB-like chromosome segregation protein Spo0J
LVQPMVQTVELLPAPTEVVTVALADLTVTTSFREGGLSEEHVQRLVALAGHWPPVLVNRSDGLVIDGAHRVEAARILGLNRIEAWYFDGAPDDALIEFVRRNVHQGLPLTLRERKRAAEHVLIAHPEWSDRRIAELCAISPKTVGRLRGKKTDRPTGGILQLDARSRIGRDNKWRPVHSASIRSRVAEALKEHPGASLRSVAKAVGVSPETVRIVRMNMDAGSPDVATKPLPVLATAKAPDKSASWDQDLALVSSDDGEDFVAWFDRTTLTEEECWRFLDSVPLSRIYEIADEARRRSEVWTQFAKSLDVRWSKRK